MSDDNSQLYHEFTSIVIVWDSFFMAAIVLYSQRQCLFGGKGQDGAGEEPHTIWQKSVNPPTSLYPTLSAYEEPISRGK